MSYLQQVMERNPPKDPSRPIYLKFALDGATMTSGVHKQQEVGAFQVLYPGQKLADVKSPTEAHMWIIYLGGETYDVLRQVACYHSLY